MRVLLGLLLVAVVAGKWVEPSAMGPFQTKDAVIYVNGTVKTHLYYPVNAPGPLPLVANAGAGPVIPIHLASHGIVIATGGGWEDPNNGTCSDHQLRIISALRNNISAHPVLPKVDFSHVGLMGWSHCSTCSLGSAARGAEGVVAAALIHGVCLPGECSFSGRDVKVPTFYMCGEDDHTVPCESVKKIYDESPKHLWGKNVFAELAGAKHGEITIPLPGGRWNFYIVEFMMCWLSKNQTACGNIYGTGPDALCTAGLMTNCTHSNASSIYV